MRIAILGGGITGMTAYCYCKRFVDGADIKIFTKEFGGEFSKGGFKYLHYTPYTKEFLESVINYDYGLKIINGVVYFQSEIRPFPYGLRDELGKQIHKEYWNKTRGDEPFDPRCMNDPYNTDLEISITNIDSVFNQMKMRISEKDVEYMDLGLVEIRDITREFDIVIYTLPIKYLMMLNNYPVEEPKFKNNYNYKAFVGNGIKKVWWDYAYIASNGYQFHRVSKDELDESLKFESNIELESLDSISSFIGSRLNINPRTIFVEKGNIIKGHISKDLDLENFKKPSNVFLLGRYAQHNKRITWDVVVKRLYKEFIWV